MKIIYLFCRGLHAPGTLILLKIIRGVYANGKQYQQVQELKNTIIRKGDMLSQNYIQKLYKSIPNLIIEVIENKGGCIHY